jgi:chemotaxis protein MotB
MRRVRATLFALTLSGCGVTHAEYEAKVHEAESAKSEAEASKRRVAQLEQQLADEGKQSADLKSALGIAQAQAITDEQKTELEDAKRAMQEAQERGKTLDELQSKFKKMIDAGRLKLTTRHGRAVLQLHNDVLFDTGEADVNAQGKQTLAEVAANLRGMHMRRFQVAGHTDTAPITAATKKKYATNWELSTARAIAVVKILVADGVEASVLSAAGYGPYDPIASNGAADGQAKNRRIEIVLMPNLPPLPTEPDKK